MTEEEHAKRYPEHQKLKRVAHVSQEIGRFLDWTEDKGWRFGTHREGSHLMDPVYYGTKEVLLAEFFEIDLTKIENEKCAMLDELRCMSEPKDLPFEVTDAQKDARIDDLQDQWLRNHRGEA